MVPTSPRQVQRTGWVLAGLLTITFHMVWGFWFSPRAGSAAAAPSRGPAIRFVGGDHGRQIWVPTVLALPTEIGFSGGAVTNSLGEGPPLRLPRRRPFYLAREGYAATAAGAPASPPLPVGSPAAPPVPDWAQAVPAPAVAAAGLTVRYAGRPIPDPLASGLEIPPRLGSGSENWQITVAVEFTPRRQVAHAILETSSGDPARDRAILQAVYRWRPRTPLPASAGPLSIRYLAPFPTEAP